MLNESHHTLNKGDNMGDFLESILALVAVIFGSIVGLSLLIGIIITPLWFINVATCDRYHNITGRQTRAEFPNACYIKMQSGWYPDYQIKATN
jgi:hypothetical protein